MTVTEPNTATTESSIVGLASATVEAPFGTPLDPYQLKGKVLTTPYRVIEATAYLLSDRIFNFALPTGPQGSRTDNLLKLWTDLKRANLQGDIPEVTDVAITTGSGSLINGYLNEQHSGSATVFGSTPALKYLKSNLQGASKLHLSLQIATVDYDFQSGQLVSNYGDAIEVARSLRLPVLVSTSATEAQHYTALSIALARKGVANIHLFDGLSTLTNSRTITGVLSSSEINHLASQLTKSLTSVNSKLSSEKIPFALDQLNAVLDTRYVSFEYFGTVGAQTLFVASAADPLSVGLLKHIDRYSATAAAVLVKSPLPFDTRRFNEIAESASKIVVLSPALKNDVQASLYLDGNFSVQVIDESTVPFGPQQFERLLEEYVDAKASHTSTGSSFRFLYNDNSNWLDVPGKIAFALSLVPDLSVSYTPIYDNSINAGVFAADIQAGKDYQGRFNLVVLEDASLLNAVDVSKALKDNATLLVINPVDKVLDADKFVEKLSPTAKKLLAERHVDLRILDLNAVGEDPAIGGRTSQIATQVAFWTIAYPDLEVSPMVNKIWNSYGSEAELLASVISNLAEKTRKDGFKEITYQTEWVKEETDETLPQLRATSFSKNPREEFIEDDEIRVSPQDLLAKQLIFKEAYETKTALRPDQPTENYVIRVKENKRVTPADYSRNIFEIEFDISGTGMKYSIGEALGVHARNNPETVEHFIQFYGLNPNSIVEVVSHDDPSVVEERTVRQALTENVDLLGKASKKFYESLIEYATDEADQKVLKKLVAPAGGAQLKSFQEDFCYNYVDAFEMFSSARPTADKLLELIPPLKRREYSIASSQKMHPNEVHLLVVVVDWVDKAGRQRYGQCSKYLSDLKVGDELVVSVKPSLMKLPPTTQQPIIMAGLGTGLAPFKAFVEERQYQQEQGEEVGEIYLYLGSRHKKQEYLYGEYWEAYLDGNLMTHLGAAFSRDQASKIYIQDKIRENLEDLTDLVCKKKGHFYLCGPTWPVPDITACLEDIYTNDAARRGEEIDAVQAVEEMKEDGRYVLEVY